MWNKLFTEIVHSSLWGEDDKTRVLFVTMLALKNRDHYVAASVPGLARLANISLEDCEKSLEILEGPDPHSRSTEMEGRRLLKVDGGWVFVNGEKWANMIDQESIRARWRDDYHKKKGKNSKSKRDTLRNSRKTPSDSASLRTDSAHTDTDTDTDADAEPPPNPPQGGKGGKTDWSLFGPDFRDNPEFREVMESFLERKKPYKPKGWKAFTTQVNGAVMKHGLPAFIARVRADTANQYQGIVWDKIGGVQKTDRPQELTAGQIQSELGRMRDARQRDAERGLDNWAEHNTKIEAFKAKHNATHF